MGGTVPTGAVLGPAVGWLCKVLQLLLKLWADHTLFPQELSSSWSPPGLAWDLGPAAWQSKDAATWLGDLGGPHRMDLKNLLVLRLRGKEVQGMGY